jgi:hypothetical protein
VLAIELHKPKRSGSQHRYLGIITVETGDNAGRRT